jgi:hypothetical protein
LLTVLTFSDIVFRRILRGEAPFSPQPASSMPSRRNTDNTSPIPELTDGIANPTKSYTVEILQTLAAGSLSAILTYPYGFLSQLHQ